jgi:hypothetical protein
VFEKQPTRGTLTGSTSLLSASGPEHAWAELLELAVGIFRRLLMRLDS